MQWIDTGTRVGHGISVEGGTVGRIGGIGRRVIQQTYIYGVLITYVFDGDGVTQGFAGHQNIRIPRHDGGGLLHLEDRR